MKTPRIVKSLEYIDDELIATAERTQKAKHKALKWTAIVAGFMVVVITLVIAIPPLFKDNTEIQQNKDPRYKDFVTSTEDIAIVWPWEYKTIYEKYFLQFLEERDLEVDPLWEFSYQLIMSIHHPLAMKKTINCAELDDFIEITHGYLTIPSLPASKAREMRQTEGTKREIAVYERESQFMLLRNIHKTYMWASPTPASIMDTMPLIQKKCNMKNNKYKDVIIRRKGYRMTPQEKLFVEMVRKEIEKLSNSVD